jgi:uncharacterized protein YebE (UPF0316 family)
MELFFAEHFGVSKSTFDWVVLPLVVFLARITDVSLSTIRIMFVMSGRRNLAPLCGFLEASIWILAIGQIIRNLGNPVSYIAYAGGFATGTYIGMYLESKLALGKVIVRVITRIDATEMVEFLKMSRFGFTNLRAEGRKENVNVIFSVIERRDLPEFIALIKQYNPNAFYTIEGVRYVSDGGLVDGEMTDSASVPRQPLIRRLIK